MDHSPARQIDSRSALPRKILLAVPESDCHVVGNKLLELDLKRRGYDVCNLGACTPDQEIAEAARAFQPDAIIISSQNGHALEDLTSLPAMMQAMGVATVPIYLGGNLSVGAEKRLDDLTRRFSMLGVQVVTSLEQVEQRLALP